MGVHVYVPTMERRGNLRIIVPKWLYHFRSNSDRLNLVVAQSEYALTAQVALQENWPAQVQLLSLPPTVQGIGAIRAWCVEDANVQGFPEIIMADDDIFPSARAVLDSYATAPDSVLGVGCVTSYHSLLLGDRKDQLLKDELIFARSGYGFRMFYLNIERALEIGNFDRQLNVCYEDAELMRQGIHAGYAWWLDPMFKATALGKRFEAGGLSAYTDEDPDYRRELTDLNYARCYEKWPDYMAEPPKKRMSWKKFLDHHIGDWQDL